jgi:hypothetical protein
MDDDALVPGDLNAHDAAWFSSSSDARGESLAQQIDISSFFILNSDSPTRCPSNGNNTSPDISLISAHLALSVMWAMCTALNSGHLPISITFCDDRPPPCTARSSVNFKRAKWGLFTSKTEPLFSRERPSVSASAGKKKFRRILAKASKHHIPAGFRIVLNLVYRG